MGIRNMSRNESTKLNDPDIPQQSLHLQQHITGVLDSSKILVRRAKEHKICLKVISIIKWEKLFFPYYKCLYTIRPRGGKPFKSGLSFLSKMFGTTLELLWDQQLRGFRKWPHNFLSGFNTIYTRAVNKLGRLRSTSAAQDSRKANVMGQGLDEVDLLKPQANFVFSWKMNSMAAQGVKKNSDFLEKVKLEKATLISASQGRRQRWLRMLSRSLDTTLCDLLWGESVC